MQSSTCQSCRAASRLRFHFRLIRLKDTRRRFSSTPTSSSADFVPQSWYWDTKPPDSDNLKAASDFFQGHRPFREWTGTGWRRHKASTPGGLLVPEVVFLGRSNVGKSSLVNHLTYSADLNRVSNTPGHTKAMWAWSLAAKNPNSGGALRGWGGDTSPKVTLVDMPGYGYGSDSEWGDEIVAYMKNRVELRRAFVVIDAMQGVTKQDRQILDLLRSLTIPYQIVISKCDKSGWHGSQVAVESALLPIRQEAEVARNNHPGLGELILVGRTQTPATLPENLDDKQPLPFGISNLQWSILRAAGLDQYAMQHQEASKSGKQKTYSAGTMVESFQPRDQATPKPDGPKPQISLNDLLSDLFNTLPEQEPSRSPVRDSQPRSRESWKPPFARRTEDSANVDSREQNLINLLGAGLNKSFPQRWGPFQQGSQAQPNKPAAQSLSATGRSSPPRTIALPRTSNRSADLLRNQPDYDEPSAFGSLGESGRASVASGGYQAESATASPFGKGVSQGIDAFQNMLEYPEDPSLATKSTKRRKKRKSKNKSDASSSRFDSPTTMPPSPPRMGKGVSQGLDAFESMFANESTSGGRKKSRR